MILARYDRGKAVVGSLMHLAIFAAYVVLWFFPAPEPRSPRQEAAAAMYPFMGLMLLGVLGWFEVLTWTAYRAGRVYAELTDGCIITHEPPRQSEPLLNLEAVEPSGRKLLYPSALTLRFNNGRSMRIVTGVLDEPHEVVLARFQALVEQVRALRGAAVAEVVG